MAKIDKAIVIQGPYFEDRTRKIIEYMLENNQESHIILSTWNHVPDLKHDRLHIISSPEPQLVCDHMNRMKQRLSTWKGIELAKTLNCEWILKMRTDHLLRRINICQYLQGMIELYPVIKKSGDEIIKKRIITSCYNTTNVIKWGNFRTADFWQFGHIDDMKNWYSMENIDLNSRLFINNIEQTNLSGEEFSPEPDFTQYWMMTCHIKATDTYELIGRFFILIDEETVGNVHKYFDLNESWQVMRQKLNEFSSIYGFNTTHEQWLHQLSLVNTE